MPPPTARAGHRSLTPAQLHGLVLADLPVGQPLGDERCHLPLARREREPDAPLRAARSPAAKSADSGSPPSRPGPVVSANATVPSTVTRASRDSARCGSAA